MTANAFPSPQLPRVGMIGDTHGNVAWTRQAVASLAAAGIDMAVQLGDFGWNPHSGFPEIVSTAAGRAGVTVCFIDGNHEHHEHLRAHAAARCVPGGAPSPVEMYDDLWYLPRGCSWEWWGVRFRALGGAFSVDHASLVAGHDWFPVEEMPSAADADEAIKAGPADVLVCHDYPAIGYELRGYSVAEAAARSSRYVRRLLGSVVDEINPKLVIHGHWHHAYTTTVGAVTVKGLDRDGADSGSVAVLDLETLYVEDHPLAST